MEKSFFTGCTISNHKCRCFTALSAEEQKILDEKSVSVEYKRGEIICKQGGLANHILYVEKGLVKVYLDNGISKLVLKIIPECNLLGLASLSQENNTFQYSAMAYLDSEVRQIDIGVFQQMINQNPKFSKEVIEIFIANSAQINGRFFSLTHKQSYGRLADIILCLADRVFKTSEFNLDLTRKDLAELTGMSQETAVRMLKKFKDEGLILIDGKNFRILDYTRLKKISEAG